MMCAARSYYNCTVIQGVAVLMIYHGPQMTVLFGYYTIAVNLDPKDRAIEMLDCIYYKRVDLYKKISPQDLQKQLKLAYFCLYHLKYRAVSNFCACKEKHSTLIFTPKEFNVPLNQKTCHHILQK